MKLFGSLTSPYVRKVRAVAVEKGLEDQIDLVAMIPWEDPAELHEHNPLGKVPALESKDHGTLYDSRVICAYLDSLKAEPILIPGGTGRWQVMRAEALGDGVLDTAVAIFLERKKPADQQNAKIMARNIAKIRRSVAVMDESLLSFPSLSLAHIATSVALAYLDLRIPDSEWRAGNEGLTVWHKQFQTRPSMTTTAPVE